MLHLEQCVEWMNDILYRADHEATYDMRIQLCISASTTATTELAVKQVKPGLEARLGSTQTQFCSVLSREMVCAQPNTFGLFCAWLQLSLNKEMLQLAHA
jgi:hypothetical protein